MSDDQQPSSDLQPMDAHKSIWSQQDLLKTILDRSFVVHGSIGGTVLPAWNVSVQADQDVHEQLILLNKQ